MVQCEFTEADFVGFTVRGSSYEIGKERVKGVVEFVIRRHGPEYSVRTEVQRSYRGRGRAGTTAKADADLVYPWSTAFD
jgi:hypothetical protein